VPEKKGPRAAYSRKYGTYVHAVIMVFQTPHRLSKIILWNEIIGWIINAL